MIRPAAVLAFVFLLFLPTPAIAAGNQGPAMEWADPAVGSYTMAEPGPFEVEVECADDPDGDDVFVDFIASGQVLSTEEDYWGFSPSFTFNLGEAGSYTLQARCRDTAGAASPPNHATWTVQVSEAQQEPPRSSGVTSFEWVDPAPGRYALDGAGGFDVEVECVSNDGVFVDFLVDGAVVETDQDFWGPSPSYSFLVFEPGTHVLSARCRSDAGLGPAAEWVVDVPRASSQADLLRQSRVCTAVQDPAGFPDASGPAGSVQDVLVANPGFWHRTGPWTCELAKLAGPVSLAYDINQALVDVKAQLDEWAVFDYSAWDFVASLHPAIGPAWEFFEGLLPILKACATALDGIGAFTLMRTASLGFLTEPTDGQLALLQEAVRQAMPAYAAWIEAFDLAAAKVAQLAAFLSDLAAGFVAAALELDAGDWFPFRDSISDGLRALAAIANEWATEVLSWAAAIQGLADPARADLKVMKAILDPPEPVGAPAPAFVWLVLAVAALAAWRRRRPHP